MVRTRRAYLAAGGTAMGALAGCFGDEGPGETLEPGTDSVDLLLNWQPGGLHVPYYVARDQEFYQEHGISLDQIERGQGSDFSATQAGLENVEFAITSSDQILNVNSEGVSVVCVGVIMQRGPVVVFTDRDEFGEELEEPAQLEGTTIGSGPGMVQLMTQAYLDQHDLTDDVELADAGADTVQQLLVGEVDVAAGVFSDVVDARNQDATIDELSIGDDISSYGHVIATSESFLEENPDTVRAFLRGTARGSAWAAEDVDGATDILVDAEPELEETRENQRDKWDVLQSEYLVSDDVEDHGWGWNDGEVWQSVEDVLSSGEFLESDVDPDSVWTNDYLDGDDEYVGNFTEQLSGEE